MTGFFTPNPKKNFIDNYGEHLAAVNINAREVEMRFWKNESIVDRIIYIGAEIVAHIHCNDTLYDRYDYADTLLGATAVPLFSALDAVVACVLATWHGLNSLAVMTGCANGDADEHIDHAVGYFIMAAGLLVFALTSLVDSIISLISRPLLTSIYGFKPQDDIRFDGYRKINDDSTDDDALLTDTPTL